MDDQAAAHLADNIRSLREARGLTQQQMAKLSGVPRPTWANLESGGANPTLSVLVKAANALQVRLEELIGPTRSMAKIYRADALPARVRERGAIELTAAGERWSLGPGDVLVFRGDPKHGYRNPGRHAAVAYSVIAFAPVAS